MAGENDQVDVAELEKQYAELGEQIVKLGGKVKYPDSDDAKLKAKKGVERVKLDKAKAKADDESDDEEPDFDEDDDMPPKKTKKADESDKIERDEKKVEKVEKDEELVFKGQTIKKSVVGADQFVVFKSMADELTKASTDIAKAQDDALMARLEKRAEDDYSHVPGTTQERAAMLKAMSTMDEKLRKSFEAVFAQSEKLAKSAFDTVGVSTGDSEDVKKARSTFDAKVTEIAKRDNVGRAAAMAKARTEFPEEFKAYQEVGSN